MGTVCVLVFIAYFFVTVALPALVFGPLFANRRLCERFMIYCVIGNFFVINLVQILQLMKISNRFTLTAFTILAAAEGYCRVRGKSLAWVASSGLDYLQRLAGGQVGLKTALYRGGKSLRKFLVSKLKKWFFLIIRNLPDVCLLIAFSVFFIWIYGLDVLKTFGYGTYDMPVHTEWVNQMGINNNIFSNGVYPFGMHCMIYYIVKVFGIDIYLVMRVFSVTETYVVIIMMLCLLKYCCKTRYMPYLGLVIYNVASYFSMYTYHRFYWTLPQEFGMIFIYPSIYFGFAFFKERREKRPYFWCLAGFALSFSLTLTVHFYGTIVAGLLCVGMAVGYAAQFIKWDYFWRVVLTCIISVMIAVLPMATAFFMGTPLQGSLGWAMGVITGGSSNGDDEEEETTPAEDETEGETQSGESEEGETQPGESETEGETHSGKGDEEGETHSGEGKEEEKGEGTEQLSIVERIKVKCSEIWKKISYFMCNFVFADLGIEIVIAYFGVVVFIMLVGTLLQLLKHPDYGGILISFGMFVAVLTILLISPELDKVPTLMDINRSRIYLAYTMPLPVVMAMDFIVAALFYPLRNTRVRFLCHFVSLVCVIGYTGHLVETNQIRQPLEQGSQQTNEAITCLTNIIREEDEDFHWTIVSASDERNFARDHGYHFEIIDLLRRMEYAGGHAIMTIPTETVYFFVEKMPLCPAVWYDNGSGHITEEDAKKMLPRGASMNDVYDGEARWIVMARMYYWAQEFMRLYPNEMTVFMENDTFVCYRVTQNPYNLYNFAIDYGYNMRDVELDNQAESEKEE